MSFEIAKQWTTITEEQREPLRKIILELVGYPCKIACSENNGFVDITVFSVPKNKVTDWLEVQPNGAFGVIFDMYQDSPESHEYENQLEERCKLYNAANNIMYDSEDTEDTESKSSGTDDYDW